MAERNWIDKLINIQVPDDSGNVDIHVDGGHSAGGGAGGAGPGGGGAGGAGAGGDAGTGTDIRVDAGKDPVDIRVDAGRDSVDIHVDEGKNHGVDIRVDTDGQHGAGHHGAGQHGAGQHGAGQGSHPGSNAGAGTQAPPASLPNTPTAPQPPGGGGGSSPTPQSPGSGGSSPTAQPPGGGGGSSPTAQPPSGGGGSSPTSQPPSGGGSSPTSQPPGGGGGGGSVTHTPSLIKQLGQKIAGIEATLEKASSDLEGADISSDAFSGKGIVLANVYPAALDFGKNDVKTKITQLKNMSDGLIATAATWEQAEQASTVKTQ